MTLNSIVHAIQAAYDINNPPRGYVDPKEGGGREAAGGAHANLPNKRTQAWAKNTQKNVELSKRKAAVII